jgi:hypothetical protein
VVTLQRSADIGSVDGECSSAMREQPSRLLSALGTLGLLMRLLDTLRR